MMLSILEGDSSEPSHGYAPGAAGAAGRCEAGCRPWVHTASEGFTALGP